HRRPALFDSEESAICAATAIPRRILGHATNKTKDLSQSTYAPVTLCLLHVPTGGKANTVS
ncbi:MAG: hypothetical protein WAK72_00325, partial [Pseudolabrys sp.]